MCTYSSCSVGSFAPHSGWEEGGILRRLISRTAADKGRTIRKVMGGGGGGMGKSPKKIHARENAKKKNSCKEEGKEKKIHAEGRSNCDFYLIYKICQQAC